MATAKKAEKKGSKMANVKKAKEPSVRTGTTSAAKKSAASEVATPLDKTPQKRERFMSARRNNDILVVRISSDILTCLAEKGWQRVKQGGAATIAREVIESWYLKECENANKTS